MKFKRFLFWASFPFTALLIVGFGVLEAFSHAIVDRLHAWEGWTGDYDAGGWERIGGGLWTKSWKSDEANSIYYEGDITEHGQHNYGDR